MNQVEYSNFRDYFPSVAETALEVRESDKYPELIITMKDGRTAIYNELFHSLRVLPEDSNNLTEEQNAIEFSNRLRKVMIRQGFTQGTLSEATGISAAILSGYMTGKHLPGFHNFDKIAKALNCSADELRYI